MIYKKNRKKWHKIYALYHGDHFLCTGTKKELSKFMGFTNNHSVDHYLSPYYYKNRFLPHCSSYLVIYVCDEFF